MLKRRSIIERKSTMGQVVSIFITILIISVISAMTFLFVGQLKTNAAELTRTETLTVTNESGAYMNITGYTLATVGNSAYLELTTFTITEVWANVSGITYLVPAANYSVSSLGVLTNATVVFNATQYEDANVSYTGKYIPVSKANAWISVNTTEAAGMTVTSFLTILFLAMIFSAILTVVMRFVLPFLNLGNQLGGF